MSEIAKVGLVQLCVFGGSALKLLLHPFLVLSPAFHSSRAIIDQRGLA